MHPLLLPGTHPLRRGDGHLQVGLTEAAVLPGPFRSVPALVAEAPSMAALARRGLATADDRAARAALPPATGSDPWPRHTAAALVRRVGARVTEVATARAGRSVEVRSFGHPLADRLAEDVVALRRRAGLGVTRPRRRVRVPAAGATGVGLLVGVGEPTRDLLDPWVRDGRAHLVVRLVEGAALLGPLVQPGRTACVRCVDAYLTEDDPSWPLLVEQYARASAADRADGMPEPVDAALATIAVGWAVRDLATYVEEGTPTTWSSTVRVAADLSAVESRSWSPHPSCGCTWA